MDQLINVFIKLVLIWKHSIRPDITCYYKRELILDAFEVDFSWHILLYNIYYLKYIFYPYHPIG